MDDIEISMMGLLSPLEKFLVESQEVVDLRNKVLVFILIILLVNFLYHMIICTYKSETFQLFKKMAAVASRNWTNWNIAYWNHV